MAFGSYKESLDAVLVHEGGFSNHPLDPGGATMQGVIQRVYDAWRKKQRLPPRSVRLITAAERDTIYREQYWDAVRGDELAPGLDYAMFDYAVNSGPVRAIKAVQRLVRVEADGHFGLVTLATLRGVNDVDSLIAALCDGRLTWLQTLRHWRTFGRGWRRRVEGVKKLARQMYARPVAVS